MLAEIRRANPKRSWGARINLHANTNLVIKGLRYFDVLAQFLQKGDLYVPSKETRYRRRSNYLTSIHIASSDGTDFVE